MKRKVICTALALTMGLSMATPTFAGYGTGDVNADGIITAADAASVLQYVLDDTFEGGPAPLVEPFYKDQANYNGDYQHDENGKPLDEELISAADCEAILNDVRAGFTDVVVRFKGPGNGPGNTNFTVNATDSTSNGGDEVNITQVKAVKEADRLMQDTQNVVTERNVDRLNNFLDKLTFNGANIREEKGWNKFADAVGGLVQGQDAFDALKDAVMQDKLNTAADVQKAYNNFKKAFPSEKMTEDKVKEASEKVKNITGDDFLKDFLKVEILDPETNEVIKTMATQDVIDVVIENKLYNYADVTVLQLINIFGTNGRVTVSNPNTGMVKTFTYAAARD